MKKTVALILCFVMVVGLMTGCQKAMDLDTLMKKVEETMATATHTAGKVTLEMDIQLGAEGMTLDMGMDVTMDMKATKDMSASWMDVDMVMDFMGESMAMDMELYTLAEGDEEIVYMREDASDSWIKTRRERENKDASMTIKLSELPREKMTLAPEKETVNGRECYVVNIQVEGAYVQSMLETTMPTVTDDATQQMMESMDWSKLNASFAYYVDAERFEAVQVTGDIQGLGDVMAGMMGQLLGGEGMEMAVSVPVCKISMTDMAYTGVEVPAVPQEVIDNAVDADADVPEDPFYEDVTMEQEADGSYVMHEDAASARIMLPEGFTPWVTTINYMEAENEDCSVYLIYDLMSLDVVDDSYENIENALQSEVDTLKQEGDYKSHTEVQEVNGFKYVGIVYTDGHSDWDAWREIEGYVLMISAEVAGESFDMAALLAGIEVPAA